MFKPILGSNFPYLAQPPKFKIRFTEIAHVTLELTHQHDIQANVMPSMEALPVNPNKPQEEEGKLNTNTNNNNGLLTSVPTPKDHTIEAAQQVFDEMPKRLSTTQIEETPAITTEILITTTTEIVSQEQIVEQRSMINGVDEGITATRIEETATLSSSITNELAVSKEVSHGLGGETLEVIEETSTTTVISGSVAGADQVFDEMSEQVTTLNDAADAVASAIVSEIVVKDDEIVEQEVFDEMSTQNNETAATVSLNESTPKEQTTEEQDVFDGMSEGDVSEEEDDEDYDEEEQTPRPFAGSEEEEEEEEEEEDGKSSNKRKRKSLSSLIPEVAEAMSVDSFGVATPSAMCKKSKKKKDCVWTKSTSRKGKKKGKLNSSNGAAVEDTVLIVPVARFPDRSDDSADMKICLSKMYKAEKVELSEDRLSAGSSKGYRMVRATRGVVEGAWYFEIKISKLGETGHTRLGWSMEKGDLQAPVGYDANSFGYRDIDGSKVHKATREKYGDAGYVEGDTIGFYINLPNGAKYAPKPPQFVWYKGQKYMCAADGKEEAPKVVPGSEICFFKNGVCQGIAFKDLYGGRYYPAASMYTLPNQPNCVVKFNFGPDFECFPQDFDSHPLPMPMIEVPYLGFDGGAENGVFDEKKC